MRRVLYVISAVAMLATPARGEVLSWQGVGPVQLGMTVKAAERALGTKLEPRSAVYISEECYETWRADGKEPGIGSVVENGKITVIQVYQANGQTPDVADTHRLGIGATEDDIRRAYGQVKKSLGFYDRGGPGEQDNTTPGTEYTPEFWIEAEGPDHKRSILFVTEAGKVTSISTGFKPVVLAPEHCL